MTNKIKNAAMTTDDLANVIKHAIKIHAVSADLRRLDREIFPTMISDMYHHGLTQIARFVLTNTLRPSLMSEIQKLILSFFDSDFGLFALPSWRISKDDQLCAEILSRIAYDTISVYLAPLTKFYTFDRIDELLENTENAFCDALETINIDALF
jgi:hypothetical protein